MARRQMEATDVEIQLLFIGALILLVTIQAFMIAWGLNTAAAIAGQVERPDRATEFFKLFLMILVPFVGLNAAVGTCVARRISRPLDAIKQAMKEIGHGNLEQVLEREPGEFLGEHKAICNQMADTLRRLIYRDRDYASQANHILSQCEKLLEKGKLDAGCREKLETLLKDAKSHLSIINDHFLKGRKAP